MALIHGDNTISLLADDNTVTGDLWFIPRYESFDDLTLAPR
jgi:hypothetical protein